MRKTLFKMQAFMKVAKMEAILMVETMVMQMRTLLTKKETSYRSKMIALKARLLQRVRRLLNLSNRPLSEGPENCWLTNYLLDNRYQLGGNFDSDGGIFN
jgi:hypothetical protein